MNKLDASHGFQFDDDAALDEQIDLEFGVYRLAFVFDWDTALTLGRQAVQPQFNFNRASDDSM